MSLEHVRLFAVLHEAFANGSSVRFRATGDSMYPTIRHGEVVSVAALSGEPACGDVLLCRHGNRLLAHRLIAIRGQGGSRRFHFRGDAKGGSDAPVEAGDVLGQVTGVIRRGRVVPVSGHLATWRRGARMRVGRVVRRLHHARVARTCLR